MAQVCLLNVLKEKYRPRLVVLCTILQIPMVGTLVVDFINGNVTRWNELTRGLVRNNPGELRLMDLENKLRMIDHVALTRDGMYFNTQQGRRWINDVFQTQLRKVCLVPNPNSQSGLCASVLLNTEATRVTVQSGKKLGYALPLNTDFQNVENLKMFDVTKCILHAN